MLISPPEVISIIFAGLTAIIMAIPIMKRKRISINPDVLDEDANISRVALTYSGGNLKKAVKGFNRELWNAFEEQRVFTQLGLLTLMFSILFQILS